MKTQPKRRLTASVLALGMVLWMGPAAQAAADLEDLQKYYPDVTQKELSGWIAELEAAEGISTQEAIEIAVSQEQEAAAEGFVKESATESADGPQANSSAQPQVAS